MDKTTVLRQLETLLGQDKVLHRPEDVALYEYDGALDKAQPDFVVFPETTEEVAAVVRLANEHGLPFMPRGAGTGLSGGAVPVHGGVVVSFARMRRILDIDAGTKGGRAAGTGRTTSQHGQGRATLESGPRTHLRGPDHRRVHRDD